MYQNHKGFGQSEQFKELARIERPLWAALPHQFGNGKVHLVWENGKTKCGKFLDDVPGRPEPGHFRTSIAAHARLVSKLPSNWNNPEDVGGK
jgi:hypothetical protein